MKHLILLSSVLALTVTYADMKIGTVDMLTLVKNHPNYESNKSLLVQTEKDYQKKLEGMKSELEKIQEEGKKVSEQARNPMLAATAKTKLEKDLMEIQSKFMAGQQRMRSEAMRSQQDLQDLEGRLLKATTADLKKRLKKFAESNGYDFIADQQAVPFARDSFDVTSALLRDMGVDPAKVKKDEGK